MRPEIICQQLEKRFWNKDSKTCVDFITCREGFQRNDEINSCYEVFCPKAADKTQGGLMIEEVDV